MAKKTAAPQPAVAPGPMDKGTLVKLLQEQNLAAVQAFTQELQELCAKHGVELTAVAQLSIRVKE